MAAIFGRIISTVMTEKMISKIVVEVLKVLAARTTNTIDDNVVDIVERNLSI